ncbi:RHS repeat-associated core domain-containing protein [Streptomyces sp. NPDC059627]
MPFGGTRGTAPTTWPGDKGYIGGTPDPTTSMENLGAREYDPANGRFLSVDPVFNAADPIQLAGYDYSGNNPTTRSDPTGRDNWWADPTMNKPVGKGAKPITRHQADEEGFGDECTPGTCSGSRSTIEYSKEYQAKVVTDSRGNKYRIGEEKIRNAQEQKRSRKNDQFGSISIKP